MQIILALIGALIGARLDEWRGALFGGALGYAIGEVWSLKQRLADLAKLVSDLRSRLTETSSSKVAPASAPSIRESGAVTRPEVAPNQPTIPVSREPQQRPITPSVTRPTMPHTPTSVVREEFVLVRWLREFFTGGNTVVRISIAILFVGIALLLKYASEHARLPIEFRLIGGAILAIGLLVLGWRLRRKRFGYAIALQGGATGILYLIVFFALRTYALLPASVAFALLSSIVILSATLAILQDAMWLALLGISGGFLAPILTSTGHGSHIALFTFYAVLNIGIVVIAWFKAWRALNVMGFAFTFVIGVVWGVQQYKAELFSSTEPFLVLFFLMYVAIAILFAARQAPNLKGYVDGTIVFGVPIAAFALQSALLYQRRYWLSLSALLLSALYIVLAATLWRRRSNWRLLSESFAALSVAFATLAIPLALNGRWSAASWALEGAALVWVGCRQSRLLPRLSGLALQFAAAAHFLRDTPALFTGLPILNSTCLGALILAGAGLYSSRVLRIHVDRITIYERIVPSILFFWALIWWLFAGVGEIDRRIAPIYEPHALLAFFAITGALCSELRRRLDISVARWPALSLLPVMAVFVVFEWLRVTQPFANFGWLSWPLAWFAFYFTLRRHEDEAARSWVSISHVGGAWLLAILVSREIAWLIDRAVAGAGSWPAIAWAIVPATALFALPRFAQRTTWPLSKHDRVYVLNAGGGFAIYLIVWSLFTSVARNGDPYPLPYLPILNPLDIAQLYVLIASIVWLRHDWIVQILAPVTRWSALGVVIFIWLNAILLRTIHYWVGVPYDPRSLWRSVLVQASLSIFWTCLALATMVIATQRGHRMLWCVGASLMAVVVAKLFVVDLNHSVSIPSIASFIGVGLLMLIIGYFAPIPPQQKEQTS